MNLQPNIIRDLTLKTKVYHPIFGEGKLLEISLFKLKVKFQDCNKAFEVSGIKGETLFIEELYLKPIKIVEI